MVKLERLQAGPEAGKGFQRGALGQSWMQPGKDKG